MRSGLQSVVLTGFLVLGTMSCDRNIAPFVPGETPRQPDLSRIFPAPESESPMAGAPGMGGGGPARTGNSGVGRPGAAVRGRVSLAEPAAGHRGTLFIIARPEGVVGGPPLAVLRVSSPEFPLAFEIGPDQVMIPGMRFEGPIALTARLDGDGDAMTRDAGDPETPNSVAVVPGSLGVELLLSSGSSVPSSPARSPSSTPRPSRDAVAERVAGVRGRVSLGDSLGDRTGTLFIVARARGVERGPPMAVLRISDPRFPLDFEIGPDQVMLPGVRFAGAIDLTARLDSDGDAMTRDDSDPQTAGPLAVVSGAVGVEVLLR
ncbi:MAG TPA: hypothetical protein EYG06_03550 [Myxococcales bacterium]|nr:hypothetical protein [Myxococcales bacterium]